jgi:type IV pilus assembly protein PilY1
MSKSIVVRYGAALLLAAIAQVSVAEDIDIFKSQPTVNGDAPNVLFILDNSANWSKQSQAWPSGNTQGEAELLAIRNLLAGLDPAKPINIGLMMLTERGNIGGYVRFGVRPMVDGTGLTAANEALQELADYIYEDDRTNNPEEKVSQSKDNYANAMYETYLYLKGEPSWAGDAPKNNQDKNNDKRDHATNTAAATAAKLGIATSPAYQGSTRFARYNSMTAGNICAGTYIVWVGNNRTSKEGGMPAVPGATDPAVTKLNQYSYATPAGGYIQATWARFLYDRPDLGEPGSAAATDGRVITFTIDAYYDKPNPVYSDMMYRMAVNGGGEYYQANSDESLAAAFQAITDRILAKNSVFAAVSLPVSVNQRGTYLNQVYLGVFRPDGLGKPNWPGNLKQYQIAVDKGTDPPTLFLADANGARATSSDNGFINSDVTSYWTKASGFWDLNHFPATQGTGGASDAPDGDLVEKGGIAQGIRIKYPTDQSARKVYTCTTGCIPGSLLSATPFGNANVLPGVPDRDLIINWVRGANNTLDDPKPLPAEVAKPGNIRGLHHGDVLHSRPAVVNYGRDDDDIYVFYGANDGMLHAVKGGRDTTDGAGEEQWAFVAPEHFTELKKLRDHEPTLFEGRKPYFIDGSPIVYTHDVGGDGAIESADGDKAYLYLSMRRGGSFIYALDVSDPEAPKFLWKRNSSDIPGLGQTWSDIQVAKISASGVVPVLIFGLGYDALKNDDGPAVPDGSGNGVVVLNAVTGAQVWVSTDADDADPIRYSIPAGVAAVDSDGDGLVDRIIAADTGGNIWRMNIDDADTTKWTVRKVLALDATSGRRFLNTPDVVLGGPPQGPGFDAILIGSGDREQPLSTSVEDRFYMIKDKPAKTYEWEAPLKESDLYDATANLVQVGDDTQKAAATAALGAKGGWYIRLGTGEKVVGPSTSLSGTTFFGTNTPNLGVTDACIPTGIARIYAVSLIDASATIDRNSDKVITTAERSQTIPGGGFPPPPTALQLEIDGQLYQAVAFGTQLQQPPGSAFGRRFRSWWFQPIDR